MTISQEAHGYVFENTIKMLTINDDNDTKIGIEEVSNSEYSYESKLSLIERLSLIGTNIRGAMIDSQLIFNCLSRIYFKKLKHLKLYKLKHDFDDCVLFVTKINQLIWSIDDGCVFEFEITNEITNTHNQQFYNNCTIINTKLIKYLQVWNQRKIRLKMKFAFTFDENKCFEKPQSVVEFDNRLVEQLQQCNHFDKLDIVGTQNFSTFMKQMSWSDKTLYVARPSDGFGVCFDWSKQEM